MKKRLFCLFLAILTIFALLPGAAFAEYDGDVLCEYVLLVDADSGLVLYEKNADEQTYPASTTKIMTCLIVLENCENIRTEKVTVGSIVNDYGPGNSLMGLVEGEELTVRDLLYGLMLPSGNDAAAVLAEHFGGSLEGFAEMMNAKAAELGMTHTHFVTPHGLPNEDHYTTVRDMSILVRYAMQNGDLMAIVGSSTYTVPETNKQPERTIYNSNRFISAKSQYQDFVWDVVTGMKTGYTNAAGGCLVTTATDDGKNLICITYGGSTGGTDGRWRDARNLLEYGFEALQHVDLSTLTYDAPEVEVDGASNADAEGGVLELTLDMEGSAAVTADTLAALEEAGNRVSVSVELDRELSAPVTAGEALGTARLSLEGVEIAEVEVTASRSIASVEDDPRDPSSPLIDGNSLIAGEKSTLSNGGGSVWLIVAAVVLLFLLLLLVAHMVRQRRHRSRAGNRHYAARSSRHNRYR